MITPATRVFESARTSSIESTPPEAITGIDTCSASAAVAATLTPRPVPSRAMSGYSDRPEVGDPLEGVNVYSVSGGGPDDLRVHARVFVPGLSVPEDPATGSAAAGLGIALVETGRLPRGGRYTIRQGLEMGRPSTLHGWVEVGDDGRPTECRVAGEVQLVASGEIVVPD